MLLFHGQFDAAGPLPWRPEVLPTSAVALLALLTLGNIASTLAICGVGLCTETPSGYLIFHENIGLAFAKTP
jgi:hypothetical protein